MPEPTFEPYEIRLEIPQPVRVITIKVRNKKDAEKVWAHVAKRCKDLKIPAT